MTAPNSRSVLRACTLVDVEYSVVFRNRHPSSDPSGSGSSTVAAALSMLQLASSKFTGVLPDQVLGALGAMRQGFDDVEDFFRLEGIARERAAGSASASRVIRFCRMGRCGSRYTAGACIGRSFATPVSQSWRSLPPAQCSSSRTICPCGARSSSSWSCTGFRW